jgi:hypothetical protein
LQLLISFFIKIDKNIFQEGLFLNAKKNIAFHDDTIFLEIYFKFFPKDHLSCYILTKLRGGFLV